MSRVTMVSLLLAAVGMLATPAAAQYGGGSPAAGTGGSGGTSNLQSNYHIGFDRPESWGLKYFASSSLLSGLPAPPQPESTGFGSVSVSVESDWLPQLDAGQERIGFNGTAPEALNKSPIVARAVVRVGLPDRFTALVAAPPPLELFELRPHLLAFGLEHPILEGANWTVGWRGYGQVGSAKGAFTCPTTVLGFAPGSPANPTSCVGKSADVARLRYAGSEFEFSYRLPQNPKIAPHVAVGGNFMDLVFQTHAPVVAGLDETRMWTRGGTFSATAGVTYLLTRRAAVTVDAFYSPLWVVRSPGAPRTNDGLFNVRALLSYTFR